MTVSEDNLSKWDGHGELKPEEEGEYLKDLCAYLRNQQTLSEPTKNEDGVMTCEVVPDDVAAHVADVIEELWERLQVWESVGFEFDSPEEQKASLHVLLGIYMGAKHRRDSND